MALKLGLGAVQLLTEPVGHSLGGLRAVAHLLHLVDQRPELLHLGLEGMQPLLHPLVLVQGPDERRYLALPVFEPPQHLIAGFRHLSHGHDPPSSLLGL